jgi:ABC-type branched-subunit amino acid transport system ATPase component
LLKTVALTKYFGGLAAVSNLDLHVRKGEIFGLIGPNGAGKSTILNMIGGSLRPRSGQVVFEGEDVTKLAPHGRARRSIARVFQANTIFPDIDVQTNVRLGFHLHSEIGFWDKFFERKRVVSGREAMLQEKTLDILRLVGLHEGRDMVATSLPHASQRHLCLAIALATEPSLLLLDEPVTGMTAEEVARMLSVIRMLRDERAITCIVVEHNMRAVMSLCDRIAVINYGTKIAEGSPDEISENPAVIEAYLGVEDDVV